MFGEGRARHALGESVRHILRARALSQLEHLVADHVSKEVKSSVNVSAVLRLHWVMRHGNAGCVVFIDGGR
eukprot:745192-Rhodomonas_salina.1